MSLSGSYGVARLERASRRPAGLGRTPDGGVSLAMGEPDGRPPADVEAAAEAAIAAGLSHYAPLTGDPDLRARIAAAHSPHITDASGVTLGHGATGVLASLFASEFDPGDRLLIPEPTYSLYADLAALTHARVTWSPTRQGRLDLDRILEQLPGHKAIILCNPSNPTGLVIPASHLRAIAAALHPDQYLIVDEAYADIHFGQDFASASALVDATDGRVVVVRTFSKTYAMTGWRLGYALASPGVSHRINLVQRTHNGALNTVVQAAASAALNLPESYYVELRRRYRARRDLAMGALASLPGVTCEEPEGAFYVFPRVEAASSSDELVQRLARGGLLVRSGREYGPSGEGRIRLSFAASESVLAAGLDRLGALLAKR